MTEPPEARKVEAERVDVEPEIVEAEIVEVVPEPDVVPSPDFPTGDDEQLDVAETLPLDRACACVTRGKWTPTDQCAIRPATRCAAGSPVWAAAQVGGPDAAAEAIKAGNA